uniref:G-protein coupled receptors family 1 profile domain-containing protein n=1 Tax=Varanus komodoensis TaxID=61221 RepID=A0A8D2IRT5_VARKO
EKPSSTETPPGFLVCLILSLCFVIGVPGNALVVWTICRRMKQRSLTVILILHLAIADLLVLMTLPVWIYSFAHTWLFGLVACKALVFLIYCSMYTSIFLITALSLERYVAVFYPFVVQRPKNKKATHLLVLGIWSLSIVFGATIIPFQETEDTDMGYQCAVRRYDTASQEVTCLLLETAVGFLIPLIIISVCYACISRRIGGMTGPLKRRSSRLIASVVAVFCLCWLPHHIFNLISVVSVLIEGVHSEIYEVLETLSATGVYIAGSIIFVSSCINPLLYAFAARSFQSSVRGTKMSKLFEQVSPLQRQGATRAVACGTEKEDTPTSMEVV